MSVSVSQARAWPVSRVWASRLALVMLIGVALRFVDLDRELFWHDESSTAVRIAGYTRPDVVAGLYTGRDLTPSDLLMYAQLTSTKGLGDVIHVLRDENSQHPPLYFILLHLWARQVGDSVTALRLFSALWSVLTLPALFWLGRELFKTARPAWLAVAIAAVSPFHFIYAREAREYSLWAVLICLSSALLLRALRLGTWPAWAGYSLSVAIGLYTHPFTVLFVLAHAVYVVGQEVQKLYPLKIARGGWSHPPHSLVAFVSAAGLAGLLFVPWALTILGSVEAIDDSTGWARRSLGPLGALGRWLYGPSTLFLDLGASVDTPPLWTGLVTLGLGLLLLAAMWYLYRAAPSGAWVFVLALIAVPIFSLALPDLLLGGRRVTTVRYLTPSVIGIQVALAYGIDALLRAYGWRRRLGQVVLVGVLVGGLVSELALFQVQVWNNKGAGVHQPGAAALVNAAPQPIILAAPNGNNFFNLFSLALLLEPGVRLRLLPDLSGVEPPIGYSDVFIYRSGALRRVSPTVTRGLIEPMIETGELWRWRRP